MSGISVGCWCVLMIYSVLVGLWLIMFMLRVMRMVVCGTGGRVTNARDLMSFAFFLLNVVNMSDVVG